MLNPACCMKTILLILLSLPFNILFAQTNPFEDVVNYYSTEKNFNGVALVATSGKIDYLNGTGIANRQSGTTINSKTKFKIASITKTFTAVLILQLYEQGKLDLKATIGRYLPGYKGEAKDKATIHHLLVYSSGIPNCEGNTGIAVYQSPITTNDFIEKYCSGKLVFEPGTQFSYNNGDYILLGKIIEAITGKTFAQNIKEKILQPLSMENTGMLASKDIITGLAATYNIDDSTGAFFIDDPMYIENYYAAGAMYATAEDLLKFSNGIFGYKLLTKKTVELMLTPNPSLYNVAYGFWVSDNKFGNITTKVANRQGSIWGANTNWLQLINQNKAIIILSNTNATNLMELAEQLVLAATTQKTTIPATPKKTTAQENITNNATGTWLLDLRPTPNSEPYLKDFIITPRTGKGFDGEFYGTPFTAGKFNTDWEYLYFAFTTSDKDNTYFHSGYIDGNKISGISYSPGRKFTSHWTGIKKN
jgi:CubicO group peptidase (beta-lactamase class C family)